jgi:hypothetical protein
VPRSSPAFEDDDAQPASRHFPDSPDLLQETFAMPSRHPYPVSRSLTALLVAAVVGATACAQDEASMVSRGVPVIGAPAGADCESCRSQMRPPWHGSAMAGRGQRIGGPAPCMTGACGPGHVAPCRSCGPAACGPCAPGICGITGFCHAPAGLWGSHYPLPPCLPRLHAYLREGMVLSPQPLVVPKCHECGAVLPMGF